ncbi:MAG: T9SS type A sorting domain-containing protein, partial [Melioribacteraceae bacterium]|nr:T9SS type A sorting domain-containing protein [Melioribacteraceae bacterium]
EKWYLKRDLSPCIDAGDPSSAYEDIEDPTNVERAYFPALGTKRNDIGAFGGPHSKWMKIEITTDIDNIENLIPQTAHLSQNYPNPFNPSTTIKYSISNVETMELALHMRNETSLQTINVELKIYDLLGQEVTTLVNEKQKVGNYEVTWEAGNYPNGVYFYKLKAGDFTETRKMILLK